MTLEVMKPGFSLLSRRERKQRVMSLMRRLHGNVCNYPSCGARCAVQRQLRHGSKTGQQVRVEVSSHHFHHLKEAEKGERNTPLSNFEWPKEPKAKEEALMKFLQEAYKCDLLCRAHHLRVHI